MSFYKISSPDQHFLDFYEPLAHALQGHGVVYTPHPVIPLNARMAIPAPDHILVVLESDQAFTTLYATIRTYLERDPSHSLTLHVSTGAMTVSSASLPAEEALRRSLLSGEE